jgi:signal peptidase I
MIGVLKKRKLRKELKGYLHAARHARHMREDIADPKQLEALKAAEANLREIHDTGQGNVEKAVVCLSAAADKVYPSVNNSGMRENVEVIIVALAAAMAIRAFFFQPFKIPTGSMQPTLNGITTEAQASAGFMDRQPLKFVKWLVTGASYKEVRAKATGAVVPMTDQWGRSGYVISQGDKAVMNIGGVIHKFPSYMKEQLSVKEFYSKGDVICSSEVVAGDHILVNKMKYNFMRPERGDISVFDTVHLEGVREGSFYIKRMVGLSGEKIQIQKGRIVADGKIIADPPIFEKIATDPAYSGHSNVARLASESDFIQLTEHQYLMCGDNTNNSRDSRFFGGVPREDFQGPAFFVYWPFRSHWGIVR